MDIQTLLILIAISTLVLVAGLVIAFESQGQRSLDRRAEATITQIQVGAGTMSSWWRVTAEWLDPQTGRILTFPTPRLNFPPHHHIWDPIVLNLAANQPNHYYI